MGCSSSTPEITSSKPTTPRPIGLEEITIWIEEARSNKSKVKESLDEIKKMRSEMLKKNIDIGDSKLVRLHRVEKEKAELLNRLSSLASDRMRNQNAKIADLSDTNRPTKLTERFSELYDNEWTDAFTTLRRSHDDREAIEILLLILKNCYTKCKKIAENQRYELGQKFFSKEERKGPSFDLRINECQKQIAKITYKDLQQNCKDHIEDSGTRKEDKERNQECLKLESVQSYCKSCIELTWLMCIQAPPIQLEFSPTKMPTSNYFRHYTRSGDELDFVVWPVLFLHENGPVLSKGVIQFKASGNLKDQTKFTKAPEAMSEINKQNGSHKNEENSKGATETNSSENQSQETIENTKHSKASKIENFHSKNEALNF